MKLTGKVALITGGARVGSVVALELARRGCHVALTYNSSAAQATRTVRAARAAGRKAEAFRVDLRDPQALDGAAAAVVRKMGGVDILVHMASVYKQFPIADLERDPDLWSDTLAVELGAAYRLAMRLAPVMRRRGQGRIVLLSDWLPASGRPRYKEFLPYYVAKAGEKALAEALALELAPKILVNAVAPGPILPPDDMPRKAVEEVKKVTPLGRWGGPEAVAKAVLFFVESDFVTGETLRADGGRHLL